VRFDVASGVLALRDAAKLAAGAIGRNLSVAVRLGRLDADGVCVAVRGSSRQDDFWLACLLGLHAMQVSPIRAGVNR
jgi:hypothetical protein